MSKILWVLNKYVGSEKAEEFYPHFLLHTQKELEKKGHELSFVLFSELLASNEIISNKFIFKTEAFTHLTDKEIDIKAHKIEREYEFTFKQAYFADIIQTFKGQNERKITVPEKYFSDLSFLVPRFLFLEQLISSQKFDVILSDASPEVEMEFGRVIGNKLNKIVFKTYEGGALGGTVLLQLLDFGKDRWIEVQGDTFWTKDVIKDFCKDFIKKRREPYKAYSTLLPKEGGVVNRIIKTLNQGFSPKFPTLFLRSIHKTLWKFALAFEGKVLKKRIYDNFDPKIPNIFMGFHLNQESTMVLRSQPFTNQIALIEMISRVLPFNYVLYVREHPHWPERFPFQYLKKVGKLPNIRLISPKISIHDILKDTTSVITYNATTGIEALLHGKPVLSFASNLYHSHHSGVDQCLDLYELGKKLSQLVNKKVDEEETFNYIYKLKNNSLSFVLGSYNFYSKKDSREKAISFSSFLDASLTKLTSL